MEFSLKSPKSHMYFRFREREEQPAVDRWTGRSPRRGGRGSQLPSAPRCNTYRVPGARNCPLQICVPRSRTLEFPVGLGVSSARRCINIDRRLYQIMRTFLRDTDYPAFDPNSLTSLPISQALLISWRAPCGNRSAR